MSEFVVAGATGRVGSVVVRRLLEQGHSVTALTRSPDRAASLNALGASAATGTLADAATMVYLLDGADGFFVLLPEPIGAPDFHGERRIVVEAIARAVKNSSVDRVVALSSLGAQFSERMGPITDLHYFEEALGASGKRVTILRAATFQDNVTSLMDVASRAGIYPNLQPDRDVAISMVATGDVGEIAAKRLTHPRAGDVVDILGPWYSPRQVAESLGRAIGRSLEIVDIPPEGHVATFCQAGLPQSFAVVLAELQQAIADRRITPVGDARETGWITLDDTLAAVAHNVTATQGA